LKTYERIPTLDGWRAVAIAAVMLSHGFLLSGSPSRFVRAISYTAEYLGGLGVALFFAISGYLITTLLLRELEDSGRISLKGFYCRRAFRILPPAYLYLAALWCLRKPLAGGELASAAFFFSNYWADRLWFTQHFWSLSMEEHFYLFWPAMLALLGIRRAAIAAGFLIVAVMIWRPWSLAHVHLPFPALQRTDMRIDAFLCAGVVAILLRSKHERRAKRILESSNIRIGATLGLAAASVWAVAGSAPATVTLAQSILLPILLVSTTLWRESLLWRFLESAPLRWMGGISYGLYLWQQMFLVSHTQRTLITAGQAFLPRVAAVFGLASASYYLLERPLLRYGRGLSAKFSTGLRQVSWNNESYAPNTPGSSGVRPKA